MDNNDLISNLRRNEWPISDKVIKAMERIDRKYFVPEKQYAYYDIPLNIGYGQTISQASLIGYMLTKLDVSQGNTILEIGTGSGYQTAILCELTGPKGKVVSVDRIFELTELARFNLNRFKYKPILETGDASCGWDKFKPFDRIIAGAAYPGFPNDIKSQLKKGGIFIAPIGRMIQYLIVYYKSIDKIIRDIPVMFVPMIGKCAYKDKYKQAK